MCKMKLISISVNDEFHVYISHNQATEQDNKKLVRAPKQQEQHCERVYGKKWNTFFLPFAVRYAINLLPWFTEMEYNCKYLF